MVASSATAGPTFTGRPEASTSTHPSLAWPPTPDDAGYWLLASDGGIFSFGNAVFYGSTGALHLNAPIVGMSPTPDGGGYWLVAADGGIFSFGNAVFYGSTGSRSLNKPIVGMASTLDGRGYWLVASDGGSLPSATPRSMARRVACPCRSRSSASPLLRTVAATGWWLQMGGSSTLATSPTLDRRAASPSMHRLSPWIAQLMAAGIGWSGRDGGIFNFGDAGFYGSAGGLKLNRPIVGMAAIESAPT